MLKCISLISLFVIISSISPLTNAANIYTWSVVPQFTGTAVHRDWYPVIKHIREKTGYQIELIIYNSIQEFEAGFLAGKPDFAYMNPYHAIMAKEAHGYIPIVRSSKRLLSGIIAVRKDSNITNVKQLENKKIAFPSPNAFAASLYMRALLREKEKVNFKPIYAGNHSNAYRETLLGQTAASGAVLRTLLKERTEVQNNLKIIYNTPKFPSHPLTAHQRVPNKVVLAVQSTLLSLSNTKKGRDLLKPILLSKPIKANYKKDYLPLKKLKLEKYLFKHKQK